MVTRSREREESLINEERNASSIDEKQRNRDVGLDRLKKPKVRKEKERDSKSNAYESC